MAKPNQLRKNRKRRREAKQSNDPTNASSQTKSRRYLAAAFFVLACVLLLAYGCGSKTHEFKWTGETMGTYYRVTLVTDVSLSEKKQSALQQAVDQQLVSLNQIFSTYIDSSELSQWNRLGAGHCLALSPSLREVATVALDVAQKSDGYFNPLVGSLVNAWGFGTLAEPVLKANSTSQAEYVNKLLASSRLSLVSLSESGELCKSHEARNVQMDLSAIAKGYAVDRVSELLHVQGYHNALVDIGGELYASGINSRREPWRLAIERPTAGVQQIQQLIAVSNYAVATSGDYRNFYEYDGIRYSHTIDPHTGYPVRHYLASLTVIADTAVYADAWATALLAAGHERAIQWAESNDLAVYTIRRDNDVNDEFVVWHNEKFSRHLLSAD